MQYIALFPFLCNQAVRRLGPTNDQRQSELLLREHAHFVQKDDPCCILAGNLGIYVVRGS